MEYQSRMLRAHEKVEQVARIYRKSLTTEEEWWKFWRLGKVPDHHYSCVKIILESFV